MVSVREQEAQLQAELMKATVRGGEHKTSKSIREVLRDMFDPTDYVKLKNFLDYPIGWVYTNPKDEKVEQPSASVRRVTFGQPKSRILKPGEVCVVMGGEAYVAIPRVFKQYAQQNGGLSKMSNSMPLMEEFISSMYLGKFDASDAMQVIDSGDEPVKKTKKSTKKAVDVPMPDDVDNPLGFADEVESDAE